eukprot:4645242-Pyramimonas_sp.AAC.1
MRTVARATKSVLLCMEKLVGRTLLGVTGRARDEVRETLVGHPSTTQQIAHKPDQACTGGRE